MGWPRPVYVQRLALHHVTMQALTDKGAHISKARVPRC